MSPPARGRRDLAFAAALIALGTALYAAFVVQDFSGPLVGGEDYDGAYRGDANYFEFLGAYVHDHWRLGLRPIAFFTTDVAYPSGTHIGLLSWCAERDLFVALGLGLFGPGPWIQLYVTLGAALGAAGVTAILARDFGVRRASLVGFAASFMSFYAWYKFPYHVNICALHWVTMSLAADAVATRRVVSGQRLGVAFLVLRAALVVLSLGLDLGYVAGHSLTSLVVTVACLWSFLGRTDRRLLGRLGAALPEAPWREVRSRPGPVLLAAALLVFGLALYVPFVLAVVRDTATYKIAEGGSNFWASQLHALFPYLPGVHPGSALVHGLFGSDEGIGEFAPGFALLGAAGVGLVLAHRRDRSALVQPMLITAVLIFAFHPRWCKTLQVFPWFAYHRVAGRGTTVLPTLLALVAVSVEDWPKLARRIVGALAVAEVATALFLVNQYRPARLGAAERAYFDAVARAPGAALLEWPFCIASADTVVTRDLCPYYDRTSTAYANRRFDGKARVSVYLSRAHKTQFASWIDAGWPGMFMPDDPTREHPRRETRCFDDAQWARFDALYRGHDFGGLQLYVDLLPPACVEAFHARYGAPVASETLPRLGPVELLPPPR